MTPASSPDPPWQLGAQLSHNHWTRGQKCSWPYSHDSIFRLISMGFGPDLTTVSCLHLGSTALDISTVAGMG